MTNFANPSFPAPLNQRLTAVLVAVLAASLIASCTPFDERVPPVPLPSTEFDHIDIQGAQVTAQAYLDPKQAQAAFGFDIRGAGLLPVRVALDNQSFSVVRINPQQTFLVDRIGQAWPVLTADQAYNRINRKVELAEMGKSAGKSAVLLSAAGAATGFGLSVILGSAIGTPVAQGAAAGAAVGAITGSTDALNGLEAKIRQDLVRKTLRNQRVQPGELAYGVLFFPGKEEARSAQSLRLSIELDSYPVSVNLPLKQPAPYSPAP